MEIIKRGNYGSVFPMEVTCKKVTDKYGFGYGKAADFCGSILKIDAEDVYKHSWSKYPNYSGVDYIVMCPVCGKFIVLDEEVLPDRVKHSAREFTLAEAQKVFEASKEISNSTRTTADSVLSSIQEDLVRQGPSKSEYNCIGSEKTKRAYILLGNHKLCNSVFEWVKAEANYYAVSQRIMDSVSCVVIEFLKIEDGFESELRMILQDKLRCAGPRLLRISEYYGVQEIGILSGQCLADTSAYSEDLWDVLQLDRYEKHEAGVIEKSIKHEYNWVCIIE